MSLEDNIIKEAVLATRNKGKVSEFSELLVGVVGNVISLNDLDNPPEVVEDGETFRDNALKKARTIAQFSDLPALADDSGLSVEALRGNPGVYSARFAGEGATDQENYEKLLDQLGEDPNRRAKFVCVLALVFPDGSEIVAEGECQGMITDGPRGEGGFGYDPVFYVPEKAKTMAELPPEVKNALSHRARAVRNLIEILSNP